MAGASPLRLAVETGTKRVFAVALDWPGWCRGGKSEDDAIASLLAHAPLYDGVLALAGLALPAVLEPDVEEHLVGGTGTDFGAPGVPAADESRPTTAEEARRLADIMAASWAAFDEIAAASPEELRKGPRGGGRDLSRILEHVVESERGYYARRLGVRHKPFDPADREARSALRAEILAVLATPSDGAKVVDNGWTTRFAARYMAWHVLDHAWEIQDRRPEGA